jgi:hypothetical protein
MAKGLRAEARTLNEWRELVAAEKVGAFVGGTEFCDATRGHKVVELNIADSKTD